MQLVNNEVKSYLGRGSMIRKMFEQGIELKKKYGADKVYDFSLGNPDLPPPPEVKEKLADIAAHAGNPFAMGYMPNGGYPELRAKLAEKIGKEQNCKLDGGDVIVTCGAAGGMNVLFRSILERGDEVLSASPYFVEYVFYVANYGGKLVTVPSCDFTFDLDLSKWEQAFTPKTKAVIINSPNNPTGKIYSREEIVKLAEIIAAKEREYNHPIYLISDEPYRFLNFENVEIASIFDKFAHAVVIGSFSKNLSLAGERLGYVAINPDMENKAELMGALTLCNRIMGFVNAPAIGQQILLETLDCQVDLNIYRERRDAMAKIFTEVGLEFCMPAGAFYFFPRAPLADESKFIETLLEERILVVPGSGFGRGGYVRFAFCVDKSVIENAGPGLIAAVKKSK